MKPQLMDTDPATERMQIELLRAAPEWKRAELLCGMIETVRVLMFSGVRERYPLADEAEARRRAADILLGEELAAKAYGTMRMDREPAE